MCKGPTSETELAAQVEIKPQDEILSYEVKSSSSSDAWSGMAARGWIVLSLLAIKTEDKLDS